MYSAAALTDAFGGIARRDQILDAGLSGTDITAAVRRGELRRVRRAHYATPRAPRAAIDAVRVGGRLCGVSALATYGVWAGFDDVVHVAVAPNASRLRLVRDGEGATPDIGDRRIAVHWVETAPNRECWRVGLTEALLQVACWDDTETALAALDTALDQRLVSPESLRSTFCSAPALARARAAAARAGSGSGYESIVVRRLRRLGLSIRQQVVVPGVGRVDGEIEGVLLLEVDGEEFHENEADRRRDAALVARGRVVIRLTTRRIREDWAGCVADILDAVRCRVAASRFQEILRTPGVREQLLSQQLTSAPQTPENGKPQTIAVGTSTRRRSRRRAG